MSTAQRPRFFLGWTVVAVAVLVSFTQVSFFNPVLGVFIPELEREFGWSRTEISLGVSIGSIVGAVMAPYFGPLIDRYGGRRFAVGGAAIMAVCLVLLSQMQQEWQFYILYALGRGLSSGLLMLAVGVTVSKWFVRRRGYAIGIMSLGTRLGFALMPIGVQLIIQSADWRAAWLGLAAIVALFGVLPGLRYLHPRPEQFGLKPDGDDWTSEPGARRPAADREYSWSRHDAMRTRAYYLVTFALALMSVAGGAINLHQIPHLVDRGLAPETAALVITIVAIFGGVGVLLEGVLDERYGARWTMVVGLLGSAFGMLFLMSVHGLGMALAFACIYGLAFGLLVASNQVVFADYFGREALGAIRGASVPAQLGMNAFGPILAGGAYDLTGDYLAAFIPLTIAYVVAAAALIIAKKPPPPTAGITVRETPPPLASAAGSGRPT